jgi:hypothetical protein
MALVQKEEMELLLLGILILNLNRRILKNKMLKHFVF